MQILPFGFARQNCHLHCRIIRYQKMDCLGCNLPTHAGDDKNHVMSDGWPEGLLVTLCRIITPRRAVQHHQTPDNASLMLGQRRRLWSNIKIALFKCIVFAGHALRVLRAWPYPLTSANTFSTSFHSHYQEDQHCGDMDNSSNVQAFRQQYINFMSALHFLAMESLKLQYLHHFKEHGCK